MFDSDFWITLIAISLFIFGMVGGMLIDVWALHRADRKEYVKQLEKENKILKGKLAFYKSRLDEKDGIKDV